MGESAGQAKADLGKKERMTSVVDQSGLRGELRHNEPMSRHTSWRVGGPARHYYRPADCDDLAEFLGTDMASGALLWLGLGSNLLVRDGGYPGAVIATRGRLDEIELKDTSKLTVGAGASCARVARQAARAGLCGVAFLAGIPGTMGGALAMNAGAFGTETWDQVVAVLTMDRAGVIHSRDRSDYQVGYRSVSGPANEWFIGCELQLVQGDVAQEQAAIRQLLEKRNQTQPIGKPSAGSTFRNPPGDYAARLIEAAGLKGFSIGGAQVSLKHANFIVNTGTASATDVESLITYMRDQVKQQFDVTLETEVHIVGVAA